MNSVLHMKRKWRTLAQPYQLALRRYLGLGTPPPLRSARQLGRRAVALGLETLDLALLHEQALLAQVLAVETPATRVRIIQRANTFFSEAIIPLEEGHHVARSANIRLSRINQALSRRTQDLATSNQRLKLEIARRRVVEATLLESKQQTIQLLEQSRVLQEDLKLLSHRILSVQEEERKRISRELHDVIAQVLTGINVRLAVLKSAAAVDTRGLCQKISRTQRLVEKSVDIVHRFAHDLRPALLDHLGLIPALHSFLKGFTKQTGIRVSLTASASVEKLDGTRRTALYRVAQEALTNVARHAQASRADVTLQQLPGAICMEIKDNGKSFNAEHILHARKSKRMGLLGMRERIEMVGGSFTIESSPEKGTTIRVEIPLRRGPKERASS